MFFTVLVFALVGAAAQMVDGTLGMGFGVTSATLLTLLGYSAVAASAGTHAAKMGTTFVSGISHWRERPRSCLFTYATSSSIPIRGFALLHV